MRPEVHWSHFFPDRHQKICLTFVAFCFTLVHVTLAKTFNTNDSQLVPHVSTELAQRCLVSEIGRDRTFSPWYDRTMRVKWADAQDSGFGLR